MMENETIAVNGDRVDTQPVTTEEKVAAPFQKPEGRDGRPGAGQGVIPERILQIVAGYQPLYVLATALDLSLFTKVARGAATAKALQTATSASERGLGMLLDALVGLGFLTRQGTGSGAVYELMPEAAAFLIEGTPSYLGGYVQFAARRINEQWKHLTESVRTGQPSLALDNPAEGTPFWEALVDHLFPWNYPLARFVGQYLAQHYQTEEAPRLLDVAAGSGVWGIAAAQAHAGLQVTAVDLLGVIEKAQQNASRFGLGARIEAQAGDIRNDVWEDGVFDAAILGQICHSEGAEQSRRLLAKVAQALKEGGIIIIADMLPNEERTGPLFTLMYALTMLVSTTEGGTFTFREYEQWLHEAGFADVHLLEAFGQTVVVATRT